MAVSDAIKQGRLVESVARDENDQPKIRSAAAADLEWARNTDPVRQANGNMQAGALKRAPVLVTEAPALIGLMAADDHGPTPEPAVRERWRDGEPVQPESAATATERLKSAQADLAELKRDTERGELVLAKDVERRLVEVFSTCKTRLLAIPSRARQALPDLSNAGVLVIEDLIREALEDLVSR